MLSRQRPLPTEFHFAGFAWPRYLAELPRGTEQARKDRYKHTGGYYHAPKPNTDGKGFYLASAGMPGLRWQWADEAWSGIKHTGWFTDDFCGDKIRGVVFALPHGRGWLAGWSMGESMASELEYAIYDDVSDAASAADSLAQYAAERERDYQASQDDDDQD